MFMTNGFKAWVECRHMPKLILTLIWKWKSCRIAERGSRGIIWGMPTRKAVFFLERLLNKDLVKTKLKFCWDFSKLLHKFVEVLKKHCQRHNGPEGLVHITRSNTNIDQISSSESGPSINFKISTKHQPLHKIKTSSFQLHNLSKRSAEKNWPASNLAWTSTSKS